ncbi:MAG: VOC family protein [Azospirillaceae bacterium]
MHRSRLACFVIDCRTDDLDRDARFWSKALGYPVDPEGGDGQYVALFTPADQPRILLQKVDHEPRIHLDIESDDKQAEVARLEKIGARQIGEVKRWVVLEAPSGHRFCVVNPQRPDFPEKAKAWGDDA